MFRQRVRSESSSDLQQSPRNQVFGPLRRQFSGVVESLQSQGAEIKDSVSQAPAGILRLLLRITRFAGCGESLLAILRRRQASGRKQLLLIRAIVVRGLVDPSL
jgi:hypothetical protein